VLSEAALRQLAAIAPTLKEGELRLLTHLTAEAARRQTLSIQASSRELENATGTARSAIQRAIDGLTSRGLIAVRQGTATKAAAYILRYLEIARIDAPRDKCSGPLAGPPTDAGGSGKGPGVALFEYKGGPLAGPPPAENAGDPEAAPVDIEGVDCNRNTIDPTLQKIFQRRPEQFSPAALDQARRWMHGYMRKFGIESDQHPPDEKIAAQFLACGDDAGGWPRLEALLHDLMAERKKAYSYAWFVSVALQRIHGIRPDLVKRQRAALKLVRSRERRDDSSAAIAAGELAEIDSIHSGLAQLPGRKRLT